MNLKEVKLSEGLEKIQTEAFSRNNLTSVTIPSTVKVIGSQVFTHNKLTQVTLNEGLQEIGMNAFIDNQLITLHIPESVTKLGTRIMDSNSIFGKGYRWNSDISKYEVNVKAQIPGFNPADYFPATNSVLYKNVTDYNYDNQTGVFTFSSNDIANAQFGLGVLLGNSTVQEPTDEYNPNKSAILFKNLQPSYNVTLNLQGGHFLDPSFTGNFAVANNNTIGADIAANMGPDKVAYNKPGYQLAGWYKDANCTQPFHITTDTVTSDMTLYANWAWDETQNPSILVAIDQSAQLKDYYLPGQPPMAKASINISLVDAGDNRFKPTKNVVIKTNPNPIMERVNHIQTTPSLQLQVLKPNGDLYTNPNDALMKLNYFASSGNPTSAAYTVQTPIDHTKLLGDYTGNMTYTISLE